MKDIKLGDKFVGSWGYDQTQYSVYEVVKIAGKSVFVRGLNGWSNLDARDITTGSKVKIYNYTRFDQLDDTERADLERRGFTRWNYDDWQRDEAIKAAEIRTIVKMSRINGQSWTYRWELDDGTTYSSEEDYRTRAQVKIIDGLKKCLVKQSSYNGALSIKIDDVIRAYHDPNYDQNAERYSEQNLYTAYNGR